MKHARTVITIPLLLCAGTVALAGTTGKIAGEVKDSQTGEPLIGATVLVEGTRLGAAADIDGYYFILNVPPGKYTVSASSVGYNKSTVVDVSVSVDLTTAVDFSLVSTVVEQEEVVVVAERRIIKRDLTSSEARIDASEIEKLPVAEVAEVLSLQAGITQGADGGIHIRGGRTNEIAYWVDGISISDVYDGSQAVQVDNQSVQELQVISGTFNAEYGQAMSGIINIVTKDGAQDYHGSISAYTGDYVTSDGWKYNDRVIVVDGSVPLNFTPSGIFYNLDDFDPFDNYNVEGSLSGPLGANEITFYVSGRYFKSNGWRYGNKIFNPDGSVFPITTDRLLLDADGNFIGLKLPDIPTKMNNRERLSGQAKLSFQLGGSAKLSLSGLGSSIDFRDYSHEWFLAPEGDVRKFDRNFTLSALWTHTLGATSFYTVNLSYFKKLFREYLFENPFDPRYILDPNFAEPADYEFRPGGTNRHQFKRKTETRVGKIDYTNQVSKLHLLKVGVEGKLHRLYLEDYDISQDEFGNDIATIPPANSDRYQEYTRKPIEFSAYIQDKLEYERMVVNIGLRFDYFNSKGKVLADPADPNVYLARKEDNKNLSLDERLARWYKNAAAKYNVSPRFGISYPITDRGVLHFSYGHFLQIPSFIHLYQKPGYKVTTASEVQGVFGNPDLEAQRTIMYEFGLQQQLTDQLSFDVTAFYRDTRDWVTTSQGIDVGDPGSSTSSYTLYINRDYANSRGVTLSLVKRPSDMWSLNLSFTFQVAEGINSNPDDELAAQRDNTEPSRTLTPLDWDQTHTANLTVGVGKEDWGVFVLGRYGSGLPYTPSTGQAEAQGQDVARVVTNNSRRRPENYTVDLRVFKNFTIAPLNVSLFLKVFNLFDRRNEVDVFTEIGRASGSVEALGLDGISGIGRVNPVESYIVRPDFYSEPREIQFGVEVNF